MCSVASGVVEILSILGFKGGQRCQYSKCEAEVKEHLKLRVPEQGQGKEWDLPSSEHPREFLGKAPSKTGGRGGTLGLREGKEGETLFPRTPFVLSFPGGSRGSGPPGGGKQLFTLPTLGAMTAHAHD